VIPEQTVEEKGAPEQRNNNPPRPIPQDAPLPQQEAQTPERETWTRNDALSDLVLPFAIAFGAGLVFFLPDLVSARLSSRAKNIYSLFRPFYPALIFLCVVIYFICTSDEDAVERLPLYAVMLLPSWLSLFITLHPHRIAITIANITAILMLNLPCDKLDTPQHKQH
jgi:hypothetical protein